MHPPVTAGPERIVRPLALCMQASEVLKRERGLFYQESYVSGPKSSVF